MSLHLTFLLPLALLLVLTTYGDLRWHRIRNVWTFGGALLALSLHLFTGGLVGLQTTVLGLLTGLGLFLPIYLLGGMAAGDVKLMAAVGALVGPKLALIAGAFTLTAGAALALAYLFLRGEAGRWLKRWAMVVSNLMVTRSLQTAYVPPGTGDVASQRFPYALAISIGAVTAVVMYATYAPLYMHGAS